MTSKTKLITMVWPCLILKWIQQQDDKNGVKWITIMTYDKNGK